jgi:hypothetical protein
VAYDTFRCRATQCSLISVGLCLIPHLILTVKTVAYNTFRCRATQRSLISVGLHKHSVTPSFGDVLAGLAVERARPEAAHDVLRGLLEGLA